MARKLDSEDPWREMASLPDHPRAALEFFVRRLMDSFYEWYERSVKRLRMLWLIVQAVVLGSGFATVILAALMSNEAFSHSGRLWLVLLAAASSAASAFAVQIRLREQYQLREQGRAAVQELLLEGLRRFAAAPTEEECSRAHAELEARLNEIERRQAEGFFSLFSTPASGAAAQISPPTPPASS